MQDYNNVTDLATTFQDGLENSSGISEQAYFIPHSYIETYAEPDPAGTTAASLVSITGNHVLKAGKAPISMEMLYDKSGMDGDLTGEKLSKIWHQGPIKFFLPNLNAQSLGTAGAISNMRGIVLIQRITGDEFWQIGSKRIKACVSAGSVSFGTGPTGEPGVSIEFESYNSMPILKYEGELPAPAAP